ncbi:TPA: WG repeat-containing protein, partial [Candidatus Poribacteria bacterium]|nr:WG repeat-containing protein [Candidatus Poribacteria bacterium]
MNQNTQIKSGSILLIAFILLFKHGLIVGFCGGVDKVLWFDFALNFSGESVSLILDQRVGYIDQAGRIMIEPQFKGIGSFSEGLAPIRMEGKWGFIDQTSQTMITPQFEGVGRFLGDMARIRVKGRWGYIDKSGQIVIEPQFNQ